MRRAPANLLAAFALGLLLAQGPLARAQDHAAMDHATMDHTTTDHATMDHTTVDHSTMDHATTDHAQPNHSHADHSGMSHEHTAAPEQPREPIPPITAADRAAAFPPVSAHAMADNAIHHFAQFNRLEAWDAKPGTGFGWEGKAWIGTDLDRLWLRSEGERVDGVTENADLEVLYGHSIAPWWDLLAGLRQDFGRGPARSWAAFGVQGLAPYKFEVAATAYVGERGRTAARVEIEYTTLLTNRLILQPLLEANLYGREDAPRSIGTGLSTLEAGLRLRYEFTRQFAPYIGIVRERAFGGTANLRRAAGEDGSATRIVVGLRTWF
ncbi:copper resistance protein B [Dokdonella sp.]|uniref:copper resistance protein B n=1 Tax=Dokdonella sp. TaxID=2291710 RepID=UPI0031C595FA|nr:copper resistance protein B [Dokdonella sp.]